MVKPSKKLPPKVTTRSHQDPDQPMITPTASNAMEHPSSTQEETKPANKVTPPDDIMELEYPGDFFQPSKQFSDSTSVKSQHDLDPFNEDFHSLSPEFQHAVKSIMVLIKTSLF